MKRIRITVDPEKNEGKPPIKDGDTAILVNENELFVVQKPLVQAIAKIFREKFGKRDADGRELDMSVYSDEDVILDAVCTIDAVDRKDPHAVADAMLKFWKDPMSFAQRATKVLAH